MTIGRAPICMVCTHLHQNQGPGLTCDAFPQGIPEAIYMNQADHREPYQGDNGVQFEPASADGAAYADELFGPKARQTAPADTLSQPDADTVVQTRKRSWLEDFGVGVDLPRTLPTALSKQAGRNWLDVFAEQKSVVKFNPNHDEHGRFTSGDNASDGGNSDKGSFVGGHPMSYQSRQADRGDKPPENFRASWQAAMSTADAQKFAAEGKMPDRMYHVEDSARTAGQVERVGFGIAHNDLGIYPDYGRGVPMKFNAQGAAHIVSDITSAAPGAKPVVQTAYARVDNPFELTLPAKTLENPKLIISRLSRAVPGGQAAFGRAQADVQMGAARMRRSMGENLANQVYGQDRYTQDLTAAGRVLADAGHDALVIRARGDAHNQHNQAYIYDEHAITVVPGGIDAPPYQSDAAYRFGHGLPPKYPSDKHEKSVDRHAWLEKFNENHDDKGQFAAGGGSSGGDGEKPGGSPQERHDALLARQRELGNKLKEMQENVPNLRDFGLDKQAQYEAAMKEHQDKMAEVASERERVAAERMALRQQMQTGVAKFNPYHDEHGKFTGSGDASDGGGGDSPKGGDGHKPMVSTAGLAYFIDRRGGFTYQPMTHDVPKSGYALSIYPDREHVYDGKPNKQQVGDYIRQHQDLVSKPDHYVGAWYNPEDKKTYLDISVVKQNRAAAERLGNKHNQLAMFDLGTFDTINLDRAKGAA